MCLIEPLKSATFKSTPTATRFYLCVEEQVEEDDADDDEVYVVAQVQQRGAATSP